MKSIIILSLVPLTIGILCGICNTLIMLGSLGFIVVGLVFLYMHYCMKRIRREQQQEIWELDIDDLYGGAN